jgi:hypothetical protein
VKQSRFFNEIATPACRCALIVKRISKASHFGVQARTFQVLAMTGWETGCVFQIGKDNFLSFLPRIKYGVNSSRNPVFL